LLLTPTMAQGATPTYTADEKVTHVLNRLTFGARPGDEEKVRSLGVQAFIDAQLNPKTIAESPTVLSQLQKSGSSLNAPSSQLLMVLRTETQKRKAAKKAEADAEARASKPMSDQAMADGTRPGGLTSGGPISGRATAKQTMSESADMTDQAMSDQSMSDDGMSDQAMSDPATPAKKAPGKLARAARAGQGFNGAKKQKKAGQSGNYKKLTGIDAIETKLVRAVESPRQLNEMMSDFWFNHFNISMNKGADRVLVGAYEEQAIRPYVMSNFRDLLGATMHHPAMMFYLDNAQNTKDGFQPLNPKVKNKGINENYARELLELHSLGVDGGYTQKDVMELARVLTGWTMPQPRRASGDQYWAYFDARRHDFGEKVILGRTIKGTGGDEIEQVLDMLAVHPSTARHISFKMAQYFVDDKPPESLVNKLSTRFTQTNGNIKSVLSTLFSTSEFWDPKFKNNKFKSPFHYAVSAMRATGMHADQPLAVQSFLKTQGQPLYGCQTPDGYKNTKDAWLNPDGLLKRMDFATKLAAAQLRVSQVDAQSILKTINGGKLSAKTQKAIEGTSEQQKVAALLGSPEFMHY